MVCREVDVRREGMEIYYLCGEVEWEEKRRYNYEDREW